MCQNGWRLFSSVLYVTSASVPKEPNARLQPTIMDQAHDGASLSSPISELPPEILVIIFKEFMRCSNPITCETAELEPWRSIACVCHRWRDIFLNSPDCFIYVNIEADFSSLDELNPYTYTSDTAVERGKVLIKKLEDQLVTGASRKY